MVIQFEGPEKKLEIILSHPLRDLRSNADDRWTRVVRACGAGIISVRKTAEIDAYLLAESSLFIWDDRILMITCGRTRLVDSVPHIIDIVNRDNIAFLFYERKNLMYPQLQSSDFESDVRDLYTSFPGKSYRLGPANEDHVHIFYSSISDFDSLGDGHGIEGDETLEILMHDLHPEVLSSFIPDKTIDVSKMEKNAGIDRIYPDMLSDSFLFEPYGYSSNKMSGMHYATIHVTPEKDGSYASFETNRIEPDYTEIINRVISVFKPARFSLVLTESSSNGEKEGHGRLPGQVAEYSPTEKSSYKFDSGYAVSFCNYIGNNYNRNL